MPVYNSSVTPLHKFFFFNLRAVFPAPQRSEVQFALLLNKAWESWLPCEQKSKLCGFLLLSRYNWPFFIHVYCESFFILARLCNFPTPVVLASALCSSPLLPLFSPLWPVTPPPPCSFSPCFSFQSDSSVVPLALLRGLGEGSRDCWTFFFLGGGGGVIWKMAPVVTG